MLSHSLGFLAAILLATSCISVVPKENSHQGISRQTITCPDQCELFEVNAAAQCASPLSAGCVIRQTCQTSLFFCDPASGGTTCAELSVNGFVCTAPESEDGPSGSAVVITPIPGSPAVDPTTGLPVTSVGTTGTTIPPTTMAVTVAPVFAPTFPPPTMGPMGNDTANNPNNGTNATNGTDANGGTNMTNSTDANGGTNMTNSTDANGATNTTNSTDANGDTNANNTTGRQVTTKLVV